MKVVIRDASISEDTFFFIKEYTGYKIIEMNKLKMIICKKGSNSR